MLPDNRIRFPAPRIDFSADVGETGQDHDEYPAPNEQARYDHIRLYLMGLLSQQSSFEAPTQYREGTPWFDLNTLTVKIYADGEWRPYAEVLQLGEDDSGDPITLAAWYEQAAEILEGLTPEMTFSGTCALDGVSDIPIPSGLQASIGDTTRCFLFINGLLIDPRKCSFVGDPASIIRLSGVTMNSGDEFTASLRAISATNFHAATVTIS